MTFDDLIVAGAAMLLRAVAAQMQESLWNSIPTALPQASKALFQWRWPGD
jgi:hypothetical protein